MHLQYNLLRTFGRCVASLAGFPLDREFLWARNCGCFIFIYATLRAPASLGIRGQSRSSGVCIFFPSCENLKQVRKCFSLKYNSLLRICTKVNASQKPSSPLQKENNNILEVVATRSFSGSACFLNERTQFGFRTEVWPRDGQRHSLAWSLIWKETWLIKSYRL